MRYKAPINKIDMSYLYPKSNSKQFELEASSIDNL